MTIERTGNRPYRCEVSYAPILRIANGVRHVPASFICSAGNHVTQECLDYLIPLIEGEISPAFSGGVPTYFRFD